MGDRNWIAVMGAVVAIAISGCDTLQADQYTATARVTYTWQAEYSIDPVNTLRIRREEFGSTSLLNQDGVKPEGAVTGPDERGLWWPALPPRPTVDELEARQRAREQISTAQLIKSVEYSIAYQEEGQMVTRPTTDSVYRQAVRARAGDRALVLTVGPDGQTVTKAEPR